MAQRLTSPEQVGRDAQMAAIAALIGEAQSGVRLVAVSGEAGIGKSRVLAEAAGLARVAGFSAHIGGCPPQVDGPPIPYAAVTQALRSILRSVDARSLDGLLGPARSELARLLPELGEVAPDRPDATHSGAARLYEAILLLIERAATPNGMLLVLEDMHWSDGPTRTVLSHLCRNLGTAPVLIALSYRTDDLPPHDPLPGLLQESVRVTGGALLHLEPLTAVEAASLLGQVTAGVCTADEAAAIVQRSAGVPLYLEELGLSVVEKRQITTPRSLRAGVDSRLAGLTPAARLLVELVAVSGGPIDTRLLGLAAGDTGRDGPAALREAMEHHFVVRADEIGLLVDLRHGLVREAVLAGMVPGEERRLHGLLADVQQQRPSWGSGSESEQAAWLARHLLAAGDEPRAVPVLIHAADAARRALAFDDADRAYRRALGIVGDGPPPFPVAEWVATLTDAASAARLAGDPQRAVTIQERAIDLGDALADPVGRSMARVRLGRYLAEAGRHGDALAVLEEAARVTTAPSVRLRACMEQVRVLLALRDRERAADQAEVAVRLATEAGTQRELARAHAAHGVALSMSGRHAEALAALALGRHSSDIGRSDDVTAPSRFPDSLLGYVDAATVLARAGDAKAATHAALDGLAAAQRLGLGRSWGQALSAAAARELVRQGQWADAREALDAGEAEGGGGPFGDVVRALLDVLQGDPVRAEVLLGRVSGDDLLTGPGYGWLTLRATAVAELELARGRLEPARRAIADGLVAADIENDPIGRVEIALLGLRIEADAAAEARDRRDVVALESCARAGAALSAQARSELAGMDTARLAPDSSPWVTSLSAWLEAESTRLGGHPDPAAWHDAVAAADQAPDRYARAVVRLRLAESLLHQGRDRAAATRALRESCAIAMSLGAAPLLEDARRLALRGRLDIAGPVGSPGVGGHSKPRAAASALGLTDREVDVLELLALGRTDREIAQQLFITEKTAGHHVSHILTKLAVSRRGEAAAVAHRHGLLGPEVSGTP